MKPIISRSVRCADEMRSWMQLSTAMDIPVCNMLCQPEKCDKLKEYGGPCSFFNDMEK